MDSLIVLVQGVAGLLGRVELLLPLVARFGGAGLERVAVLAANLGLRREFLRAGRAEREELLQGLRATPGRARFDATGADEQAEEDGPGGHGDEGTGGGRIW